MVTGSSSGFGRLTAQTLARQGYIVFATMRGIDGKNAAAATALRDLAARERLALHPLELDVTDDASVENAIAHVLAAAGRIDVVVNNAAVGYVGPIEGFTPEQVRAQFETNVVGVLRVNRAVLPQMRRQGAGLLVYVSSLGGRLVMPILSVYAASKWAAEALAEGARYELASLGIDVVIVQPGAYPTGVAAKLVPPADAARLASYGTMVLSAGTIIGCLVLPPLAESMGRRLTLGLYFLVMGFSIAIGFGYVFYLTSDALKLFFAVLFFLGFGGANFAMYTLWLPEQYSTECRASAFAFATSVGRFAGAGITFLVGAGVTYFHTIGTPVALTSIAFLIGLALLPFGEETKGKPLPA
jgi:NAD(P)-dependent dehydrogenase (short-subunit alcohol dehydrogenase family)